MNVILICALLSDLIKLCIYLTQEMTSKTSDAKQISPKKVFSHFYLVTQAVQDDEKCNVKKSYNCIL